MKGYGQRRCWVNVNKPLTWYQILRAIFGKPFTMYGWIHRTQVNPQIKRWSIDP